MAETPAPSTLGQGQGANIFVRSLALVTTEPGVLALAMEDTAHAFQLTLSYQHDRITGVYGTWERHPLSSCGGAPIALQEMVGLPLSDDLFDVARQADRRLQCTHMYDMLCLAILHAHRRREDRRYDVLIRAPVNGLVTGTLTCNGRTVLELALEDYHRIIRPERWQGVSVSKGFMPWVKENVSPEEHEYHFMMQKGLFLARAQKQNAGFTAGTRAVLSGMPVGTCFGSQPERYANSVKLATARRFTEETATDVIQFFRAH